MPVTGLPDRRIHRLCFSCRVWFHTHEGVLDWPRPTGPLSWLLVRIARALDDETKLRFYCTACHARTQEQAVSRRRWSLWSTVAFAALALAVWFVWWSGLLDEFL